MLSLCGAQFVWHILCMMQSLCGAVFGGHRFCVVQTLCGAQFVLVHSFGGADKSGSWQTSLSTFFSDMYNHSLGTL